MLRFSVMPLTIVGALTPSRHAVRLIDENVEALDCDEDVDLVAITFMTALAPRAYEIAAAFRARGKMVVAGGYHPTFMPDEVAQHFDAVVVGDAEGQWPKLLAGWNASIVAPHRATPATSPRRGETSSPTPRVTTSQPTRCRSPAAAPTLAATAPSRRSIAELIARVLWKR